MFSSTRRPPRPTLFPYTTLFRSHDARAKRFVQRLGAAVQGVAEAGELLIETGGNLGRFGIHPLPRRLGRSEEHTSELQSRGHLVCRLLLEKKKLNKLSTQEIPYR